MDDVFVGFDRPEDFTHWTLDLLNMKRSPTVDAVPHVFDKVQVACYSLILTILSQEICRNELCGVFKQLVDSLDDVLVHLHLDFEAFKVDLWRKVNQTILELVYNIVHEDYYLIIVEFHAA